MGAVTAMLLPTSSTCRVTMLVQGTTTVMLILGTTSGVPSMIPMRVTSTPWPAPSTHAVGVAGTGTAVIGADARLMSSILTPTSCARKIGAPSTPTNGILWLISKIQTQPPSPWSKMARNTLLTSAMMLDMSAIWQPLTGEWSTQDLFGAVEVLTWVGLMV